jgi:hypothetical protein
MAKGKRKREDEDLDFGVDTDEKEESEETEEGESEEVEEKEEEVTLIPNPDMNRIVMDEEEIRFSGEVNIDDLPKCPCCGAGWFLKEGHTFSNPGCGCAIHPICPKCNKCEPHCNCYRR